MSCPRPRRPAAVLAAWLLTQNVVPVFAQSRFAPTAESASAPAAVPSALDEPTRLPSSAPVMTPGSLSASALDSAAAPASAKFAAPALTAPAAAAAASPAQTASESAVATPVPSQDIAVSADPPAMAAPRGTTARASSAAARRAEAVTMVENGAAAWERRGTPVLAAGAPAAEAPRLSPVAPSSKSAARAARGNPPAPQAPRAHPRAARAALVSGAFLVGAAAAAFAAPALVPAALTVARGPALYAGFYLLSLSRFWRVPSAAAAPTRGPPAEPRGWFKSLKAAWAGARYGAEAQAPLEARVGGSSWSALRDWWLGGLRAAAVWMPVALAGMVAGWGLAKPLAGLVRPGDMVGMISFNALLKDGLGAHLLGYVASSLSAEAATLAAFDATGALARKFGAGRASAWIGGAAALAVSAVLVMTVTMTPSVVGSLLGIEAALLWLRARSGSWLAPLALRGLLSLITLEAGRLGVGMAMGGAAGALAGLPAYAGLIVTGLLAAGLAFSAGGLRPVALKSALLAQLKRVRAFGSAWAAPREGGAPHSPWPLFKLAALWGAILYAAGDMVFGSIHLLAGGTEPTPPILAQMLSSPVDLVLYNFLLVGFLEEFVFRHGLFKSLYNRLKSWGLAGGRLFWLAAVASGLIFSGAHYIDYGALLAHFGLGDATTASGLGGMYAFTLAGFAARAALGVVLAWLYAESGTLLLPILAHFCADSLEGLGLHWGFVPFLAMIGAVLLIQRARGKVARP